MCKNKITVIKKLNQVGRINILTLDIDVSEKFDTLSELIKDYVVTQLNFLAISSNTFEADKKAFGYIVKKYPKNSISSIMDGVIDVIINDTTDKNEMRIANRRIKRLRDCYLESF